ncbi:MAG: metal-dependent hydrolase [Bdellovibrionota bacterium]
MLPLAHLGIGSTLARLLSKSRWVLLGAILPDLIDKPIFFALGLPGKRGFAHTLIFAILLFAATKRTRIGIALTLGVLTHLLLDLLSKWRWPLPENGGDWAVLLWPAWGWDFPTLSYGIHGATAFALELIGAGLLSAQLLRRS